MLSSVFVLLKTRRLLPVMLVAFLLAGCQLNFLEPTPPTIKYDANVAANVYFNQWRQSSERYKTEWQLVAIRAFTREGNLTQASALLNSLPQNITIAQQQERALLSAELYVARQNYTAAQDSLKGIENSKLSPYQSVRFYQVLVAARQEGALLSLFRAYIVEEPLLTGQPHQTNLDKTWQALLELSATDLSKLAINADESVLRGWLDLRRIYQETRQDPELLKARINEWQSLYPQHPAAKNLPVQLNNVLNFVQASTTHIALLLPLNGQAKIFSNAIMQGFSAAQSGQLITPPAPVSGSDVALAPPTATSDNELITAEQPDIEAITLKLLASDQVKVYDTTTQSLPELLAKAEQEGATLVVGPLLKTDVEQLPTSSTPLNVLALNQPEQPQDRPNICYFALSPEDEARDAARHIWQQQKRSPLLLVPRGTFGARLAKAFSEEWLKQGGGTVLQQEMGSLAELRQMVNSGGIKMMGTPINMPMAVEPATRSAEPIDPAAESVIDSIYIVATSEQLTVIKSMVEMNITSSQKPALFASSRSYQASNGVDFRLEMEGLQFSDIPLLAGANPQLQQQANQLFNNDSTLVRLYAMGIDAWELGKHFAQIRNLPGFQLSGTTGILTSSSDCVITRKLNWLQYRRGVIVPI